MTGLICTMFKNWYKIIEFVPIALSWKLKLSYNKLYVIKKLKIVIFSSEIKIDVQRFLLS